MSGSMPPPTVLVLGSTGSNGKLVVEGLLQRGCEVRCVARSASSLGSLAAHERVTVIEGSFLAMSPAVFRGHVDGCDAVVSCLGHNLTLRGMFRDPALCTEACRMVCDAAEHLKYSEGHRPLKFVLHSSAGCDRPGGADPRRGRLERFVLWLIRNLVPPHRDNETALAFLGTRAQKKGDPVEWCVVRPDDLVHSDDRVSEYTLSPTLLNGLFDAKVTTRRNVADFMCRLVTDPTCWSQWRQTFPMIVDTHQPQAKKQR